MKGSKILKLWALLFCNPAMSLRLPGGPVAANHGNSGAAFAL